jgi:hypothetical protein
MFRFLLFVGIIVFAVAVLFQRYVALVATLKKSMKNPASFQLEQAMRIKEGTLCLQYRATNSFNAIVPSQAVIVNNKITVKDHSDNFAGVWNKHCAGKSGDDWKHIRRALFVYD